MCKSGRYSGGPCNPGLDLLALFISAAISFTLVLIFFSLLVEGKRYLPALLIHIAGIGIWVLLFFNL
jgi:hypothetical protein